MVRVLLAGRSRPVALGAIAVAAFLLLMCSPVVVAKSYSYSSVGMTVQLYENGSVRVMQTRAYAFSGSFSYAFLDILKSGASDVTFEGVWDADTGAQLDLDITEDSQHAMATWHYSANNETKRFTIVYRIDGVVKRYNDVAEFYWKVIEDEHEQIGSLSSDIILPSPSSDLFDVFVHSLGQPGDIVFSDNMTKATVTLSSIPKDTFVEFRVLASSSIFSDVSTTSANMYNSIIAEESSYAYPVNVLPMLFVAIDIALIAAPFMVFARFYFKYGREPKVKYDLEYEREPPKDVPPMALAAFLHDSTDMGAMSRGFLATVFDLGRRGYIKITADRLKIFFSTREVLIFTLTKKGKDELSKPADTTDFEHDVLELMFRKVGKGSVVNMLQLEDWNRKTYGMPSFLTKLGGKARKWFEANYTAIYDAESERKRKSFVRFFSIFGAVSLVIPFMLLIATFGTWKTGPIDIAFTVIFLLPFLWLPILILIASRSAIAKPILRRTPESALDEKRWMAFKKFIKDFSEMESAPVELLYIWDRYLVYAVVLDIAEELLKGVDKLGAAVHKQPVSAGWYHGTLTPRSFSSISRGFSSSVARSSSGSGRGGGGGGGFSGGGGGGGGGGSSGAG